MSVYLLAIVASIYLFVAGDYFLSERYGMGLAFLAYAVSNVGFILEAIKV